MLASVKRDLKRLRASQPFNYLATSALRASLVAAGLQSELVIRHLHRVGSVRQRLPNGRTLCLWSQGDDWISNQVFWRGWKGYEPETSELVFRLATRAQVTLDIGAHVGFYSVLAAHANPAGSVYAFEPHPSVFQRLAKNVQVNGLTNVHCLPIAAGAEEGTAEFFHLGSAIPSCSSLSYDFMSRWGPLDSFQVPVTTVDQFVRENGLGCVDLVKIDTETTEPQVLKGMAETLRRNHPIIVCEVLKGCGCEEALEEILGAPGYRFYLLTPQGPMLRDRIEGHPDHLNYLFATLSPDEVARL